MVILSGTGTVRLTEGSGPGMPLFVIERNFVEQLDPEALDYDQIRLVNDDEGVSWVYSFLSADKKKKTYYPAGCEAAKTISSDDRILFKTAEEAEKAGFKIAKDCN